MADNADLIRRLRERAEFLKAHAFGPDALLHEDAADALDKLREQLLRRIEENDRILLANHSLREQLRAEHGHKPGDILCRQCDYEQSNQAGVSTVQADAAQIPPLAKDAAGELRALAIRATPGPWTAFYKQKYDEWHVSIPMADSTMRWALFDDGIRTEHPEADAKFIAAANPQTILALLDRADAAEHDITRLYASLQGEVNARIAAEDDKAALIDYIKLINAIPNMTSAQLEELRMNAQVVVDEQLRESAASTERRQDEPKAVEHAVPRELFALLRELIECRDGPATTENWSQRWDKAWNAARAYLDAAVVPANPRPEPERNEMTTGYFKLLERFAPAKWRCTKCGCFWRLNDPWPANMRSEFAGKRSWSLWDSTQQSCTVCDNSPEFLSVLHPAPDTSVQASTEQADAPYCLKCDNAWEQVVNARRDRAAAVSQWKASRAEVERLREALRAAQIIYLGNQGVCRACGAGWTGHAESHAPGCLAALSAQEK